MYKITIDYGDEEHCYVCNVHGWSTDEIIWIKKGKGMDRVYIPLFNVRSVIIETLSKDEGERMYIVQKEENK